ncbi:hypothetical protein LTS18_010292, partial [Coniosporium uncinatum]
AHQWSVEKKAGGSGSRRAERIQQRIAEAAVPVECQQFFKICHGRQYFAIRPTSGDQSDRPEPVPTDKGARWAEIQAKVEKRLAEMRQKAQDTIREGEKNEVNPWLERTSWQDYLKNLERPDLLACIEEPIVDEGQSAQNMVNQGQNMASDGEDAAVGWGAIEVEIWKAMGGMIRFSQESVTERVGVFVRLEAIRTEKHQTRFQPLQPYMDEHAFAKHTQPWRQMVMFFARAQREHEWASPKY